MCAKTLVFLLAIAGLSPVAYGEEGYVTEHVDGAPRTGEIDFVVIHATGGPDCSPSRSFKSGTLSGIVGHFRRNRDKISIHYIIGRDGTIVRMVPEDRVAWHVRGHNENSIGIELINAGDGKDVTVQTLPAPVPRWVSLRSTHPTKKQGVVGWVEERNPSIRTESARGSERLRKDPYPAAQIDSLTALLAEIMERYHLGIRDIRGHSELDDSELDCNGKRIKRKQDPGENFPWNGVRRRLSW